MKKKQSITRYTAKKLDALIGQGKDKSDWTKVKAMSQKEVDTLANANEGPLPKGWEKTIILGLPFKKDIHIRLDADIINWFKKQGRGYQTRMNAALRSYMLAKQSSRS